MTIDANTRAGAEVRLARNSVGLAHIVFFVVAAAAPLTAVAGASPVAFAFGNGAGVPGAFVLAGLLYIIFSAGFTAMSRHVGGAGAFYTYISQGLGKPMGVAGAVMALVTYSSVQIAVYALFGVFTAGAMAGLGLEAPWWAWALAALAVVHVCGQRNISFSGKILGVAMALEIAILLLLDIGILLRGGGPEGLSLENFAPSVVFSPGLGVALVFVIGSFIGFESTAIFGEEARDPDRTIPRATYAAVLLITGFYAFSTWAIAQHYGSSVIQKTAEAGLETLYFNAAADVLGPWSVKAMEVLLIVSLFACVLSFHNTLNRYFFALGREGLIARIFGKVSAAHGSPAAAGWLQSAIAASILMAFICGGADPYAVVFSWMSALAVLGILMVQFLVSLAIIVYFRRLHGHEHSILVTLILPALSVLGLGGAILLVSSNLELLSGSDSALVKSFPVLIALCGAAGFLFAMRIKTRQPDIYKKLGAVFE